MQETILNNRSLMTIRIFAIIISIIGISLFRGIAWFGVILANSFLLWQDVVMRRKKPEQMLAADLEGRA
jgi:hypothetical protein